MNGCRKIILTFQHSQLLSQSIFDMEWGRQKPLKWQKCFVAAVPIFENLLCFLIAARNKPSIKNTSGFRGIILGLAVRLNIAPFRCNYLPLCLFGRLIGVNSSQWKKIDHWQYVGKGHG